MKVGDYVRTEGIITKVKHCCSDKDNWYFTFDLANGCEMGATLTKRYKTSPNIIELFEEHDLVVIEYYSLRYKERVTRLFEVDYKDKEFMTLKNAHCDFMLRNNEFNDEDKKLKPIIKSIVTCEQFSQMEYKVGE